MYCFLLLRSIVIMPFIFFEIARKGIVGWIWGKTLASIIVGLLTTLGLLILGVPYALILGLLAALFNYIAFVGPIAASIPAVLLALMISPLHAIAVALMYILIQVIEGFLIIPFVMKKTAGLNSVLLLFFAIAGRKLGGVLSALVAIPLAAIVSLIVDEYLKMKGENTD